VLDIDTETVLETVLDTEFEVVEEGDVVALNEGLADGSTQDSLKRRYVSTTANTILI